MHFIDSPPVLQQLHVVLVSLIFDLPHQSTVVTVDEDKSSVVVKICVRHLEHILGIILGTLVPIRNRSGDSRDWQIFRDICNDQVNTGVLVLDAMF